MYGLQWDYAFSRSPHGEPYVPKIHSNIIFSLTLLLLRIILRNKTIWAVNENWNRFLPPNSCFPCPLRVEISRLYCISLRSVFTGPWVWHSGNWQLREAMHPTSDEGIICYWTQPVVPCDIVTTILLAYTRAYPKVSGLIHNEINNNKHSLRSNTKGYDGKTY
jgi:hypothetical protein